MPVIKEEIVEQCTPDNSLKVAFKVQALADNVAVKGNGKAVFQARGTAVLYKAIHHFDRLIFQNRLDAVYEKLKLVRLIIGIILHHITRAFYFY